MERKGLSAFTRKRHGNWPRGFYAGKNHAGEPWVENGEPSLFNVEAAIAENANGKAKQW